MLKPFANRSMTLHAIPVPGHDHHAPADLVLAARAAGISAVAATDVEKALTWIGRHADRTQPPIVLIMGSLYLAGDILRRNEQPPT